MTTPPATAAFAALLDLPADTPIQFDRLDVEKWGQTLVFSGSAGDHRFELRCDDCRELRWRVYAAFGDEAAQTTQATTLVSFALGRDQHRSPMQILTEHFGLSLFYGKLSVAMK